LAKHLREYGPLVAAIGRENKQPVKHALVEKLAQQFTRDSDAWADLVDIIALVLGQDVRADIRLEVVFEEFKQNWHANRLDDTLLIGHRLGIVTKSDVANWTWVVANWSKESGSQ